MGYKVISKGTTTRIDHGKFRECIVVEVDL
jgi:hypothetical protein